MRLNYIRVKNFKKIRDVEINLEGKKYFLIIGDNGSGKTSLLQAIALALGSANAHIKNLRVFSENWKGFLPDRTRLGNFEIEMKVELGEEELCAVDELRKRYTEIKKGKTKNFQLEPVSQIFFTATYQDFSKKGRDYMLFPRFDPPEQKFLLWGRYYIRNLDIPLSEKIKYYKKVGDIFWFDQRRTIFQSRKLSEEDKNVWEKGLDSLREYLINWYYYHLSLEKESAIDFYTLLEERFRRVFNVKFLGTLWRKPEASDYLSPKDFYFVLEKDGRKYDIAEVSSGEEMLFIITFESVRLHIYNSIVLIDEIELHLNPVEQERFFKNLPEIFPECQFIITTHSPYMLKFFKKDEIIRLEDGKIV